MNNLDKEQDLYSILQIEKNSDEDNIKDAYKTLVLKYHPDKNNGDDTTFKKINMAYNILKEDKTRNIYDNYGMKGIELYTHIGGDNILSDILFDKSFIIRFFVFATIFSILLTVSVFLISYKIDSTIHHSDIAISWEQIFIIIWR